MLNPCITYLQDILKFVQIVQYFYNVIVVNVMINWTRHVICLNNGGKMQAGGLEN